MKYCIVLVDGMADYPIKELNHQTPLEVAKTPNIDRFISKGMLGKVKTIPKGMPSSSDIANLGILGYDPLIYHKGRSSIEAEGMGIMLNESDTTYRCNLVTLSDDETFKGKKMIDYSAGHIESGESHVLISDLNKHLKEAGLIGVNNKPDEIVAGLGYRHLLIWKDFMITKDDVLAPPHDIVQQPIGLFLSNQSEMKLLFDIMEESYCFLDKHPINLKREEKGLLKANCLWFWGKGEKMYLPDFEKLYGKKGCVISAVDVIKGIAKAANMKVLNVDNITGDKHTNYKGKALAAIQAFQEDMELVFIHIEAPDECSHQGDLEGKIQAMEQIDKEIIATLNAYFYENKVPYKMMVLPDHYTPVELRVHTKEPVPFIIYGDYFEKDNEMKSLSQLNFCEKEAEKGKVIFSKSLDLINYFLG